MVKITLFSFGNNSSIYYINAGSEFKKDKIRTFYWSIDAVKLHYNGISDKNISETAQIPARFVENDSLVHLVKPVPGYMRKK